MDDFLQEMGYRIMKRRKELRLTQDQVAEKSGLTPQTISYAERGEKALRPENIVKVSFALGQTPNDLLLGENWALLQECHHDKIDQLDSFQRSLLAQSNANFIEAAFTTRTNSTVSV